MDERKVKGAVANGYLKFIKRKWGVQGMKNAMEYAGMKQEPKDGEWVSLKSTYALLEWIEKEHGKEYIVEAGKGMMKGMGGDFKFMFAVVIGFERVLDKVKKEISTLLFKGSGVEINKEGKSATIRLKGFKMGDVSCMAWKGALMGVMDVTKTKGTVEVLDSGNDEDCLIKAMWN
jgi:hypothetical protein